MLYNIKLFIPHEGRKIINNVGLYNRLKVIHRTEMKIKENTVTIECRIICRKYCENRVEIGLQL